MTSNQTQLSPEDEALRDSLAGIWDELNQGRPRRAIEALLTIEDKMSRRLVPFIYNSNQRFIDDAVFAGRTSRFDPINAVIVKDRQATWTSLVLAVIFVNVIFFENTHAVVVFQDEETGKVLKKRIDTFWRMLHPLAITDDECSVRLRSSDKAFFEVGFYDRTAGQDPDTNTHAQPLGISSIDIVSAGAKEYGAGITPTFFFADEFDLYQALDLVGRIEDGFPQSGAKFYGGTPRGRKQLHTKYRDILDNGGGKALAIYWFMNSENQMPPGHDFAPANVRGDFELLPEHVKQLESLHWQERSVFQGYQSVQNAFRWWEWKRNDIRNRLVSEGIYDERLVLAHMEQEHMSNDVDCWLGSTLSPFDQAVTAEYGRRSDLFRPRQVKPLSAGLTLTVWEEPQNGVFYACGMDCAEGYKMGDEIVAYISDPDGNFVARVAGRVDIMAASREIVKVCEWYHDALFAPEVDGGLGYVALSAARDTSYPNVWEQPRKREIDGRGSNINDIVPYDKKYGWRTQGNKVEMLQYLVSSYNSRGIMVWDSDFLRDAANYAPGEQRHTSDRLMAAGITRAITRKGHAWGDQYWSLAANAVRSSVSGLGKGLHDPTPERQPVLAIGRAGVWGQTGR